MSTGETKTRFCKTCKTIKPLTEFDPFGATYRQHCRICRGKPAYIVRREDKVEISNIRQHLNELDERYRKAMVIIQEQMAQIEAVHAELINMHISVIGNENVQETKEETTE